MNQWKIVFAIVIFLFLILQTGADIVPQSNPRKEAGTIVSDIETQPASMRTSRMVIFETNYGLANSGIADLTRGVLNGDQVCVLAGEFENDSRFSYSPGVSLIYMGTSPEKASIAAICDIGSIIADNQDYFQKYAGENAGLFSKARTDCGCIQGQSPQKCCIVSFRNIPGEEPKIQGDNFSYWQKIAASAIAFLFTILFGFVGIIVVAIAFLFTTIFGFVFKKGTGFWRMLTIIFLLWESLLMIFLSLVFTSNAEVTLVSFIFALNFLFSFVSLIGYLLRKKFGLEALVGLMIINSLLLIMLIYLTNWWSMLLYLTSLILQAIVFPVIFLIKTKPLFDK